MSDERKPLEIPPGMMTAIVTSQDWRQPFAIEQVVAAWPFMRDYALEEAAKACEALEDQWIDGCASDGCGSCVAAIRAMKGGKP